MTLLEMLDVLEAGCTSLQQRSSELAAALGQARDNVTPAADEAPKRRRSAKRKVKTAKGRRSKAAKKSQALPMAAANTAADPADASKNEEAPKRGKRQALGMSFSKLRASIQARRAERRGEEESPSQGQSS